MSEVELTFDVALVVRIDVESGELRFELGAVGDPSAPTLIGLGGRTAIAEGPLDDEDREVLRDPRVDRAWKLLAGETVGGEPLWDWADGVAEAANACLGRLVKRRETPPG